MSQVKVKKIFIASDKYNYNAIQTFVSGSTITSWADNYEATKIYKIPAATSVENLKVYELRDRIKGFINLTQNWDSYNADPTSLQAIDCALQVLNWLSKDDIFFHSIQINVFPMRSGGIQFEFDGDKISSELEINNDGTMEYILFNEDDDIIKRNFVNNYELSELTNFIEDEAYSE